MRYAPHCSLRSRVQLRSFVCLRPRGIVWDLMSHFQTVLNQWAIAFPCFSLVALFHSLLFFQLLIETEREAFCFFFLFSFLSFFFSFPLFLSFLLLSVLFSCWGAINANICERMLAKEKFCISMNSQKKKARKAFWVWSHWKCILRGNTPYFLFMRTYPLSMKNKGRKKKNHRIPTALDVRLRIERWQRNLKETASDIMLHNELHCTFKESIWNGLLEYWAIRSSFCSFNRTAHPFVCSALLIRSLAHSLIKLGTHGKEGFVFKLNASNSCSSSP